MRAEGSLMNDRGGEVGGRMGVSSGFSLQLEFGDRRGSIEFYYFYD